MLFNINVQIMSSYLAIGFLNTLYQELCRKESIKDRKKPDSKTSYLQNPVYIPFLGRLGGLPSHGEIIDSPARAPFSQSFPIKLVVGKKNTNCRLRKFHAPVVRCIALQYHC